MPIEYKSTKATTLGIEDRTVTGIFCVHGNVDDGDGWFSRDRSHPGLFGDFKVDGRERVVFLWAHDSGDPPIATIDELFEMSAADLPPAVKLYAPDATGAVAVKRTYDDDEFSDRVFRKIKSGAIREMSYAYDVREYSIEEPPEGSRELPIRNLLKADLYDVSDVNWGMNPATSADGSKGRPLAAHGDAVRADVAAYLGRVQELAERRAKEGRVFSSANYSALTSLADELDALGVSLRDLLAQGEPKSAIDVRRLLLDFERTRAQSLGVSL